MDIISIENPMPGPWQAVGKVSPNNQVVLLSNLKLTVEDLPQGFTSPKQLNLRHALLRRGDC